jgi:uncharacterized protein (DUF302 family)
MSEPSTSVEGIITKDSPHPVAATVARLIELLLGRGLKVFALIDHSGEAKQAGLELRDTKLVVFGSPAAGTPVMAASPLAALELPLKVLVWDDGGQTRISYTDPRALAARHHLSDQLSAPLAGIDKITDALTTA